MLGRTRFACAQAPMWPIRTYALPTFLREACGRRLQPAVRCSIHHSCVQRLHHERLSPLPCEVDKGCDSESVLCASLCRGSSGVRLFTVVCKDTEPPVLLVTSIEQETYRLLGPAVAFRGAIVRSPSGRATICPAAATSPLTLLPPPRSCTRDCKRSRRGFSSNDWM